MNAQYEGIGASICEIRLNDTPGKDAAHRLYRTGRRSREREGKFYLPGVYPLLDEVEEGEVGCGTQDRQETAGQGDTSDNALVPEEPDAAYQRYENRARPGLWGFRAGNRPVLPGGAKKSTRLEKKYGKWPPLLFAIYTRSFAASSRPAAAGRRRAGKNLSRGHW
jgi:hypothetical protein